MTEPIDAYTLTKIEEAQGGRRDFLALVILSIVGLADVNATDLKQSPALSLLQIQIRMR